jgi:hypothetical protein
VTAVAGGAIAGDIGLKERFEFVLVVPNEVL